MIELKPFGNNKPNSGAYRTTVHGVEYQIKYHRVGRKINWYLDDLSLGDHRTSSFESKQAVIEYLEKLSVPDKVFKQEFKSVWDTSSPMGGRIRIQVKLDYLVNGKVVATALTTAKNPGNNVMATNFMLNEVRSNFNGVDIDQIIIEWGSL